MSVKEAFEVSAGWVFIELAKKIGKELGWKPKETFETGMAQTVRWYLDNSWWYQKILDGTYQMQRIGESK